MVREPGWRSYIPTPECPSCTSGHSTDADSNAGSDERYADNVALSVGGVWGTVLGGNVSGVVREQTRRRRGAGNGTLALKPMESHSPNSSKKTSRVSGGHGGLHGSSASRLGRFSDGFDHSMGRHVHQLPMAALIE